MSEPEFDGGLLACGFLTERRAESSDGGRRRSPGRLVVELRVHPFPSFPEGGGGWYGIARCQADEGVSCRLASCAERSRETTHSNVGESAHRRQELAPCDSPEGVPLAVHGYCHLT